MKIKKMKNSKTTKKKWELKMKKKEPLQCWIVNIMKPRLFLSDSKFYNCVNSKEEKNNS